MANLTQIEVNGVTYDLADLISGFVTASVNNLANYYLKNEIYTKEEVQALLAGSHFVIAWDGESTPVVADIPAGVVVNYDGTDYTGTMAASSAELNAFYLVKTRTGLNASDEYASIRSGVEGSYTYKWEKFGSTEVDVSGKADKVASAVSGNFAGLDGNGNLKDSGKKASDFATAAQGEKADTAYQKPVSGIPSTDLASGVIPDVSGKYEKPSTGIPKTDLAQGVQDSLALADSALQSFTETDPTVPSWAKQSSKPSYTAQEVGALPANTSIPSALSDLSDDTTHRVVTDTEKSTWNGKQDVIADLATIRTGAGAGATAVQPSQTAGLLKNDGTVDTTAYGTYSKPSGGIPSSDMASGVQTSLGKADTAVQPEAGKGLFSGSYTDLSNKPTIPAAQVNSDWNASSGVAQILNKPTIPDAQIQSDWNQSDNTAKDYIKNKPSIPAAQVNSDWNANSGVAQILNKPAIPDAVEANPTVPSGTTPTDLTGLKIGSGYFGIPTPTVDNTPTKNSNNLVKSGGVYDEVHPATGSSQPAGGMLPNIFYDLGTLSGDTTFSLATPADNTIVNHYYWTFDTGSTAPTITWPAAITAWNGGSAPTINEDKHYEISILDGVGCFMEV